MAFPVGIGSGGVIKVDRATNQWSQAIAPKNTAVKVENPLLSPAFCLTQPFHHQTIRSFDSAPSRTPMAVTNRVNPAQRSRGCVVLWC